MFKSIYYAPDSPDKNADTPETVEDELNQTYTIFDKIHTRYKENPSIADNEIRCGLKNLVLNQPRLYALILEHTRTLAYYPEVIDKLTKKSLLDFLACLLSILDEYRVGRKETLILSREIFPLTYTNINALYKNKFPIIAS